MSNVSSRVVELIEIFDRNAKALYSQQYNEAQLRREFIDPFIEELGWDVTNKAGNAHGGWPIK
jgi:predicted type IV restriction endonuclease